MSAWKRYNPPMLSRFCFLALKVLGWRVDVDWPKSRKYVLIVYPHTSNWDFPLGICAAKALRLRAHYIAKHTLFRKPYGWFFRALGGIPVNREKSASLARQLADRFDAAEYFVLGMAPEGTRSHSDHWKSGFYHIARQAGVPIVMAYLNYPEKRIGMGGEFRPGEDITACYEEIRRFFSQGHGKNPELAGTIRPRTSA